MSSRKSPKTASAAPTFKEATFGLLRAFGIKRVFGNPGSTELPFLSCLLYTSDAADDREV